MIVKPMLNHAKDLVFHYVFKEFCINAYLRIKIGLFDVHQVMKLVGGAKIP